MAQELAIAYFQLLIDDNLNGKTYNLFGEPISQQQLADTINKAFNVHLEYKSISAEEYKQERQAALGEFLGTVIGGIYEGIRFKLKIIMKGENSHLPIHPNLVKKQRYTINLQ